MSIKIIQGDCIEVMRGMEDKSVQCCVTSPPYYGLRDYGTAKWEGGNVECDHLAPKMGGTGDKSPIASTSPSIKDNTTLQQYHRVCKKCGAVRADNQIGLEETPEQYVEKMVAVFTEVWRVLKDDGMLWLNLGDSYSSGKRPNMPDGIKPKDMLGIPWSVAFALRADGWYLRQDIIWAKPNPMPESVTDRCTKAHEYIFLLSKNAKYYFDNEAIKEETNIIRPERQFGATKQEGTMRQDIGNTFADNGTRNKRSVWTVNTRPYSEAHFATFPPKLIEPCILAGCPEDGVVIDPFSGAGTAGLVCQRLGRNYIGIELNPEYVEMSKRRIREDAPLFSEIT